MEGQGNQSNNTTKICVSVVFNLSQLENQQNSILQTSYYQGKNRLDDHTLDRLNDQSNETKLKTESDLTQKCISIDSGTSRRQGMQNHNYSNFNQKKLQTNNLKQRLKNCAQTNNDNNQNKLPIGKVKIIEQKLNQCLYYAIGEQIIDLQSYIQSLKKQILKNFKKCKKIKQLQKQFKQKQILSFSWYIKKYQQQCWYDQNFYKKSLKLTEKTQDSIRNHSKKLNKSYTYQNAQDQKIKYIESENKNSFQYFLNRKKKNQNNVINQNQNSCCSLISEQRENKNISLQNFQNQIQKKQQQKKNEPIDSMLKSYDTFLQDSGFEIIHSYTNLNVKFQQYLLIQFGYLVPNKKLFMPSRKDLILIKIKSGYPKQKQKSQFKKSYSQGIILNFTSDKIKQIQKPNNNSLFESQMDKPDKQINKQNLKNANNIQIFDDVSQVIHEKQLRRYYQSNPSQLYSIYNKLPQTFQNDDMSCSAINFPLLTASHISIFQKWFKRPINVSLKFKASSKNYKLSSFFQSCGHLTDTIIVAKTIKNKLIGGYTSQSFLLQNDQTQTISYIKDNSNSSFLFSLSERQIFQHIKQNYALAVSGSKDRPFIGFYRKFYIMDQSNKNHNFFILNSNYYDTSQYPPTRQSYLEITGQQNHRFLIAEWEVYQVLFK